MEALSNLGEINLTIPAWEMALYIGLVSFFMMGRRTRSCLLTTYLFAFYWGYITYGGEFITAAGSDAAGVTAYFSFGLVLVAFCLMALFYEER